MDCTRQFRSVPRAVRSDWGRENMIICGIQCFLSRNVKDLISNKNSFVHVSSARNQRIECWWSILRLCRLNWWINVFKDMSAENIVDTNLTYHVEFLRFCFLGILKEELDETRRLSNIHFVRESQNVEWPRGRPDVLFYTPSHMGGRDCRLPFAEKDMNSALPYCEPPDLFGSSLWILQHLSWIKGILQCQEPHIKQKRLLVCYLHVLHSDASKISGVGVCAHGER